MALVKYGGGIIQMSGSIAGSTYARNRFGNYARARTKPVNPRTPGQVAVRAAMSELTARWAQTLTAGQRTAWNLYASSVSMKNKLGEAVYLTGFNHYIRSNSWLARIGSVIVDEGPVVFELPEADPTFAVAISEATNDITVTFDDTMDWASESSAFMIIQNGKPQNAQRNFFNGPWQHADHISGKDADPPASGVTVAGTFIYTELQRAWVRARIIRADGRLSEPFRGDAFVGA